MAHPASSEMGERVGKAIEIMSKEIHGVDSRVLNLAEYKTVINEVRMIAKEEGSYTELKPHIDEWFAWYKKELAWDKKCAEKYSRFSFYGDGGQQIFADTKSAFIKKMEKAGFKYTGDHGSKGSTYVDKFFPEAPQFKGILGPMVECGHKVNRKKLYVRYETYDVYDTLSR